MTLLFYGGNLLKIVHLKQRSVRVGRVLRRYCITDTLVRIQMPQLPLYQTLIQQSQQSFIAISVFHGVLMGQYYSIILNSALQEY